MSKGCKIDNILTIFKAYLKAFGKCPYNIGNCSANVLLAGSEEKSGT
jgi:hypothetical protein